ncbi:MAG: hypothetical protein HFJ50_06670 [Clostridia bacterium]|nr:hypothetical protein [Clostridia bacterium]
MTLDGKEANFVNEATKTYTFIVDNVKTNFELFVLTEGDFTELEYEGKTYDRSLTEIVNMELTEEGKILKVKAKAEYDNEAEYTIEIIRTSNSTELEFVKVNDIERMPDTEKRKNIYYITTKK